MKRQLPPHVYEKSPGRVYFYKRGRPSVRIVSEPFTPEFYAEIARAQEAKPIAPARRNWRGLITSYKSSADWKKLKPRTQYDYANRLDRIGEKLGHLDPAKMRRIDVIRIRDNASNVRDANYLVQVLRILFGHAMDIGWMDANPAKGVKSLKSDAPPREPWPRDMVEAFRAKAAGRTLLLFELCLGSGQRVGDVLKMKWGDIEDGCIKVVQNKTGKLLWVPLTAPLRAALDAAEKRSVFILTNHAGTGPWSYRGASDAVMKVRKDIGAEAHDIHALRHTAATELVIAGCSDELVAAVTGQSPAMVAHYTKTARQKVRAIKAQEKRK
ncbi:tyrosine-type recombinase/integrase [Salipiger thiooxidans]|uniref:tyrosine-type recombinase/integrase n=1 Tax=Salipiger thiooxidans TaxID=282683 RepID=UPI001CD651E9|nr:tyrosine-type recombinase/integrase [Salipiger thiooxidans]MCA0846069.1 tyrosine-type recombinase/integrase [Salipiger thiooxidans]